MIKTMKILNLVHEDHLKLLGVEKIGESCKKNFEENNLRKFSQMIQQLLRGKICRLCHAKNIDFILNFLHKK
jgi:hypothetical protein